MNGRAFIILGVQKLPFPRVINVIAEFIDITEDKDRAHPPADIQADVYPGADGAPMADWLDRSRACSFLQVPGCASGTGPRHASGR